MVIQLDCISTVISYTVKVSKMTFMFYIFQNKPKIILLYWIEGEIWLDKLIGLAQILRPDTTNISIQEVQ